MARRIELSDFFGGPTTTEAALRAEVVRRAHAAGWKVFSLPISRQSRPVKDAVGYPDLTLARHGEVRWIELKTEKGILTHEQMQWKLCLPRHYVIRPLDVDDGTLDVVLA